jgi:hypothetical protein
MKTAHRRVFLLLVLAAGASCQQESTDQEAVAVVQALLTRDPVGACCAWNPVTSEACRKVPPTNCGCMNQARIVSSKATRPQSMVQTVDVQTEGPFGKGSCHHNIYRGAISDGSCTCAR